MTSTQQFFLFGFLLTQCILTGVISELNQVANATEVNISNGTQAQGNETIQTEVILSNVTSTSEPMKSNNTTDVTETVLGETSSNADINETLIEETSSTVNTNETFVEETSSTVNKNVTFVEETSSTTNTSPTISTFTPWGVTYPVIQPKCKVIRGLFRKTIEVDIGRGWFSEKECELKYCNTNEDLEVYTCFNLEDMIVPPTSTEEEVTLWRKQCHDHKCLVNSWS